jgi:hypothetical protein
MISARLIALVLATATGCSWSMKSPPSQPTTLYSPGSEESKVAATYDYDSCTSSYRLPIVDTAGAVVLGVLTGILYNSATSNNQRRNDPAAPWPVYAVGLGSIGYAVSAVRGYVVGSKCNCYLQSIGEIE